ncbi:hypothetical protein VKT23_016135 [Stygiomarasmius scandens]|uniref:DUF6534 domain-containing protein n=1 Tax=Marasmiellus scandens TaxID=2682957 RepID=A0ABR1IW25_9AGAR
MISETFATTFFVSRAGMATIGLGNVLYTIAELVATVALAWSFYKSKTGIRRTDSILTRLFGWFVTRGILLSIVQVLSLALYLANPLSFIWVSLHFLQSKFYVITTLSLLNSRKHLRRRINIFDSAFSPGPTGNDTRNTDSESSQAREGIVMDISASHDTNEESVQSPTLDKDVESCLTIPDSPLTIRTDLDQDGFEMSSTATEPAHRVPRVFISREQITTSI